MLVQGVPSFHIQGVSKLLDIITTNTTTGTPCMHMNDMCTNKCHHMAMWTSLEDTHIWLLVSNMIDKFHDMSVNIPRRHTYEWTARSLPRPKKRENFSWRHFKHTKTFVNIKNTWEKNLFFANLLRKKKIDYILTNFVILFRFIFAVVITSREELINQLTEIREKKTFSLSIFRR